MSFSIKREAVGIPDMDSEPCSPGACPECRESRTARCGSSARPQVDAEERVADPAIAYGRRGRAPRGSRTSRPPGSRRRGRRCRSPRRVTSRARDADDAAVARIPRAAAGRGRSKRSGLSMHEVAGIACRPRLEPARRRAHRSAPGAARHAAGRPALERWTPAMPAGRIATIHGSGQQEGAVAARSGRSARRGCAVGCATRRHRPAASSERRRPRSRYVPAARIGVDLEVGDLLVAEDRRRERRDLDRRARREVVAVAIHAWRRTTTARTRRSRRRARVASTSSLTVPSTSGAKEQQRQPPERRTAST